MSANVRFSLVLTDKKLSGSECEVSGVEEERGQDLCLFIRCSQLFSAMWESLVSTVTLYVTFCKYGTDLHGNIIRF